jgi:hypothetical protein
MRGRPGVRPITPGVIDLGIKSPHRGTHQGTCFYCCTQDVKRSRALDTR